MSFCAKCGKYFSVTKQTDYCPECEGLNMSNVSNCDIPMPQGFGKQEGWICPVCGRGVAPHMNWCPCQGSEMKITYGTTDYTNLDVDKFLQYATNSNEDLKL